MTQNWRKYWINILLLTSSFLLFLNSCMRELIGEGEVYFFVYKNDTSVSIKIENHGETGLIDSLILSSSSIFKTGAWETFFRESEVDYSRIIFNDKKFLTYTSNYGTADFCTFEKRNPFCLSGKYSSYSISSENIQKETWKVIFTYTFTEEDYRNATPLVFGEGFVGSVWRCTEGAGLQEGLLYNELRFVSESEVQGWVQLEGESEPEWFFNATYSIEGETLTISDDGDSFTAVLNEDYTGLITNIDGEGECVFVKQ